MNDESNDTVSAEPAAGPPSVLVPITPDAPPSPLAAKKKQFKAEVQTAILNGFTSLLTMRNDLRAAVWANKAQLSAPQAWDALGEFGLSIADVSAKLDAFLESVLPGCTNGDVGVPADYELSYDVTTGRATCTEKASV